MSFAGVALAIGVPQANVDAKVLLGDLLIVGGGALWAATTLIAKGTALRHAAPEKALGYQVAMSIPILAAAAWLSGENASRTCPGRCAHVAVAYQAIWVVGLTFTAVVRAGEDLFGQQTVGLHLHHAAVRRGRRLFHHARHADAGVRRRRAAGHRRALSREPAGSRRDPKVVPDPNVPA